MDLMNHSNWQIKANHNQC